MNKKQAQSLKLSEEEFIDELHGLYKKYSIDDKEYKLYGSLQSARLEHESQDEYKVRRIFIAAYNDKPATMIWQSKNSVTMRNYSFARKYSDKADASKIEAIKDKAISTNMGTLNNKVLDKIMQEFNNK